MSCAACSAKSLKFVLRTFNYLESHDPAKQKLPYNIRHATKRSLITSSSSKYRSSLAASNQSQLSEASTKLDDAYLPFVKLETAAEHDGRNSSWVANSITNPKRPFQQMPAKSVVVADQPVESLVVASQSLSFNAEAGFGVGSENASTDIESESPRSSTFTYGEETRRRFGKELPRSGKLSVNQERTYKGSSHRDDAMASTKRPSRLLRFVGAGQTLLKPTSKNAIRDRTEKASREGGRTRAVNFAGAVQPASGKRDGKREREVWQTQKSALAQKFGDQGWAPRKRLSPDALDGIRVLHAQYPDKYTTPVLADQFKVSPEAVRRILKSKWRPSEEEEADRRRRWDKRGEIIWGQMVEIGIKPPKKWREMGIKPHHDDVTKSKRQKGTASATHLNMAQRSMFRDTDSGGPDYDTFTKGSLADRIV
ncbi:MAG: hypothetical protein LQ347_000548 [Umbilicaria vellea]|nr:MAG: hypothetical protein LQ347_000548 [Umbilicaria vellea]